MTIKEIIEKYHILANQSQLGEDTEVTGLEFSKFEPVHAESKYRVTDSSIQYATDKEFVKKELDENLKDNLMTGIYKGGFIARERSEIDSDGNVTFTDTLWCLKKKSNG